MSSLSKKIIALTSILFAGVSSNSYSEEIRDYYAEPGLHPFKESLNQSFNEHIDPFSGTLQLKYTDIHIPGNGGMDISINRSYTSLQPSDINVAASDSLMNMGLGWTMHFGRIVAPKSHIDKVCNQSNHAETVRDNPSLELGDGAREQLVLSAFHLSTTNTLITKSNWKAQCLVSDNGFEVTSPSGIKYTMDKFYGAAWYTSKIEDLNGNWISIGYGTNAVGKLYIDKVFRKEEATEIGGNPEIPVVTFEYENLNTEALTISAIVANGQRWEYAYEVIPDYMQPNIKKLVSVTRPDLQTWQYFYNSRVIDPDLTDGIDEADMGSYSINKVVYPYGASIDYTYQKVKFEKPKNFLYQPAPFVSVKTKTLSGNNVAPGVWTYEFFPMSVPFGSIIPGSGLRHKYDMTKVTSPTEIIQFYHFGLSYFEYKDANQDWYLSSVPPRSVGLKVGEEVFSLDGQIKERRRWEWGYRKISDEDYNHAAISQQFKDDVTYAPILLWETQDREGDIINDTGNGNYSTISDGDFSTRHRTNYSHYDQYGNPGRILEYTNYGVTDQQNLWQAWDGNDKLTVNTYNNDTNQWLIGLPAKQEFYAVDAGSAGPEGVSLNTPIGEVSNSYYSNGLLENTTEFGRTTSYTYWETGDVLSKTDPSLTRTEYHNYRRGIPQMEYHPEGVTLERVVNSTGTIASEMNGKRDTTSYLYDDLNRITQITPPINQITTIRYALEDRVITRGGYQRTDVLDSFGRVISTTHRADGIAKVVTDIEYDTRGNIVFQTHPLDPAGYFRETYQIPVGTKGTQYQFDALSRLTSETDSAGYTETYNYDDTTVIYKDKYTIETTKYYRIFGVNRGSSVPIMSYYPEDIAVFIGVDTFNNKKGVFQGKYDPQNGNQIIDGVSRYYQYDEQFNLVAEQDAEVGWTHHEYDDEGNRIRTYVGESDILPVTHEEKTIYTYDELDRIKTITYPRGDSTGYVYDLNGNVERISTEDSVLDYVYDKNNNLKSETLTLTMEFDAPRVYSTQYTYDLLDNLASIQYPSTLLVDYAPDPLGRATKVGIYASTIHYYPSGQVKSFTSGNGVVTDVTLDDRLMTKQINVGTDVVQLGYNYGATGNTRSIVNSLDSTYTVSSLYDSLDRLTQTNSQSKSKKREYQGYDQYGNLYTRNEDYHIYSLSYNLTKSKLKKVLVETDVAFSSVVSETHYNYDRYGNVNEKQYYIGTGFQGRTLELSDIIRYQFDDASQLLELSTSVGSPTPEADMTYRYDGNGQRVVQKDNQKYGLTYSVHTKSGQLLYEDSIYECTSTDYIRLGSSVIARSVDVHTDMALDADMDLIPDCIELAVGLSPSDTSDAGKDKDGDGILNLVEYEQQHSYIQYKDSDADGITDDIELAYGTNALRKDTDLDGIDDLVEVEAGSNPLGDGEALDTDGDGLTDIHEKLLGTLIDNPHSDADPYDDRFEFAFDLIQGVHDNLNLTLDTDNDGIPDDIETRLNLNPNDYADGFQDLDGDGYSNIQEYVGVTKPNNPGYHPGKFETLWEISPTSWSISPSTDNQALAENLFKASTLSFGYDGYLYLAINSDDNEFQIQRIPLSGTTNEILYTGSGLVYGAPVVGPQGNLFLSVKNQNGGRIVVLDKLGNAVQPDFIDYTDSFFSSIAINTSGEPVVVSQQGKVYSQTLSDTEFQLRYSINDAVSASPIIDRDGNIIIGTLHNGLVSLKSDYTLNWQYALNTEIHAAAAVDYIGNIYVGATDGAVYSFNKNGQLNWQLDLKGGSITAPVTIGESGNIYVVSGGAARTRTLWVISKSGGILWSKSIDIYTEYGTRSGFVKADIEAQKTVQEAFGNVYVSHAQGLFVYKAASGDLLSSWTPELHEGAMFSLSPLILKEGTVFIPSVYRRFSGPGCSFGCYTHGHLQVFALAQSIPANSRAQRSWYTAQNNPHRTGNQCQFADFTLGNTATDDMDNDGIPDCSEHLAGLGGSNPNDALENWDEDQLNNLQEYEAGTDYFLADTDGDGVSDYDEVITHQTDPLSNKDDDEDGLPNDYETAHNLNPAVKNTLDSDGDGYPDSIEFLTGTHPNSISDFPQNGQSLWRHDFPVENIIVNGIDTRAVVDDKGAAYVKPVGKTGSDANPVYRVTYDGALSVVQYSTKSSRDSLTIDGIGTLLIGDYAIDENNNRVSSYGDVYSYFSDMSTDWRYYGIGEIGMQSIAISAQGTLHFTDDQANLYALTQSGNVLWISTLDSVITTSLAIDEVGTVYFGDALGDFYAVNAAGEIKWKYSVGTKITGSPVIGSDSRIYFGDEAGQLHTLSRDGVVLLSPFVTGNAITSTPAVAANDDVYFTSTDGFLYALDVNGVEKWRKNFGIGLNYSPVITQYGVLIIEYLDGTTQSEVMTGLVTDSGGPAKTPWPMHSHDLAGSSYQCRSDKKILGRHDSDDQDGDLLPDCYEFIHHLNYENENNATGDEDGDLLSNYDEYLNKTSSQISDSDGDGLSDYEEVGLNTNPLLLDSDHDGIPDAKEQDYGLNPAVYNEEALVDVDEDKFSLREELLVGTLPGDITSYPLSNSDDRLVRKLHLDVKSTAQYAPSTVMDSMGTTYTVYSNVVKAIYSDGVVKWTARNNYNYVGCVPSIGPDNKLYLGCKNAIYRLSLDTGVLEKSFDLSVFPEISKEELSAITHGENGLALSAVGLGSNSQQIVSLNLSGDTAILNWDYEIGEYFDSPFNSPILDVDGRVYFSDLSSTYALSDQGELLWQTSTPGGKTLLVDIGHRHLWVKTDNNLLKIDKYSGKVSKSIYFSSGIKSDNVVVDRDKNIYLCLGGGYLSYSIVSLDFRGEERWRIGTPGSSSSGTCSLQIAGGDTLVQGIDRHLYAYDASNNGALKWDMPIKGKKVTTLSEMDGMIKVYSDMGEVFSFIDDSKPSNGYVVNGVSHNTAGSASKCFANGRYYSTSTHSDTDGISDCVEVRYGMDPNNLSDANLDSDNDGIKNGIEIQQGFDPTDPDMDNDGVLDGEEGVATTSPYLADTDGDGIPDRIEIDTLGLSPTDATDALAQSDTDGFSNLQEILAGTSLSDGLSSPGNGDVLLQKDYTSIYGGTTVDEHGYVYYVGSEGLVSLNPDLSVRWIYPMLVSYPLSRQPPMVDQNGNIYAFADAIYYLNSEGELIWRAGVNANNCLAFSLSEDGSLYVVTGPNYFYKIDSFGSIQWTENLYDLTQSNETAYHLVSSADGRTVYFNFYSFLYAYDTVLRKVTWRRDDLTLAEKAFAFAPDGGLYVLGIDGNLRKLDPNTGIDLWASPVALVAGRGNEFVLDDHGNIFAYGYSDSSLSVVSSDGQLLGSLPTNHKGSFNLISGADGFVYLLSGGSYQYGTAYNVISAFKVNDSQIPVNVWEQLLQTNRQILNPSIGNDGTIYATLRGNTSSILVLANNNPGQSHSVWSTKYGAYGGVNSHRNNRVPHRIDITQPVHNSKHDVNNPLALSGSALNESGIDVSDNIRWYSSREGLLRTGSTPPSVQLTLKGEHWIYARIEDDVAGFVDTALTKVTVNGNTAPTISITAPGDNAKYKVNQRIYFTATASDQDDDDTILMQKIRWESNWDGEFSQGGSSISTTALTANTHIITAVVTDSDNETTRSEPITVIVNSPPTVAITAPGNASSFIQGESIQFIAQANDIEDDDVTLSQTIKWRSSPVDYLSSVVGGAIQVSNLPLGEHQIIAEVVDSAGDSAVSAAITVTINEPPNSIPDVAITQPGNNTSFVQGETIHFVASATDAEDDDTILSQNIKWRSNHDGILTVTGASVNVNSLSPNDHSITAEVTDSAGGTGVSLPILVKVSAIPNTLPTVNITGPGTGSTFIQGEMIHFTAQATDAEDDDATLTQSIQWRSDRNGPLSGLAGGSVYVSNLLVGSHSITAEVTDSAGGLAVSSPIAITIEGNSGTPGILWSQDFSVDSAGLDTLFNHMTVSNGVLNIARMDSWDTYFKGVLGIQSYLFSDRLTFKGQLSVSEWQTSGEVGFGIFNDKVNDAEKRFVSAFLENGNLNVRFNNVYGFDTTAVLGIAQLNTVYQVEIEQHAAGSTLYVYPLGQTRTDGYTYEHSYTDWGQVKLRIYTNQLGLNGLIDNLQVVGAGGVVNNPPTVTIDTPAGGSFFTQGDTINFTAHATDTEDDDAILSQSIRWRSSKDNLLPETGSSILVNHLSVGAHSITAEVVDSDNAPAESAPLNITINEAPNTAPTINITGPAGDSFFNEGDSILFTAEATDTEDDDVTLSQGIHWTSSKDGPLSYTGPSVSINDLTAGPHSITADVTDSGGKTATSTALSITVNSNSGTPGLLWSQDFSADSTGLEPLFNHMTVSGGVLNFARMSGWDTYFKAVLGTQSYLFTDSLTFKAQLSTSEWQTTGEIGVGIYNDQAADADKRYVSAFLENGNVHVLYNNVYGFETTEVLGVAQLNTVYQVEIVQHATGSTLYVYPAGQTRAAGYSYEHSYTDWGQVKFRIYTNQLGLNGFIDNLEVVNP
ncbi:PQQ-binding-like beta-propeller repeat protein [Teredinibacter sp. KSP-S5-2]|uniref:outer membrane protein assembly factor BamB family protein n=1 Tax=Teredinibacter sp. KSP-S5-2 TaxID=3034506 RepID=UPI0029341D75|nr:PQQ-binding-like beta-propeller repeat protein [Teredinibacter sp. KSP-S5-2]WNO10573.1 PQQ-binding-like beta-propeller repeat protein [Teredinibacter sp. KSP-S5-2]